MCLTHALPSVLDMNRLKKSFVVLAVLSGAAWTVKTAVIAATGGADAENLAIALLWTTGMVTFLLAAATGIALLLGRTPVWARILAAIVAVPTAFVAINLLDVVVKSVYTSGGWFRDEASLVLGGVLMALVGLVVLNSDTPLRDGRR